MWSTRLQRHGAAARQGSARTWRTCCNVQAPRCEVMLAAGGLQRKSVGCEGRCWAKMGEEVSRPGLATDGPWQRKAAGAGPPHRPRNAQGAAARCRASVNLAALLALLSLCSSSIRPCTLPSNALASRWPRTACNLPTLENKAFRTRSLCRVSLWADWEQASKP